MPARLTVIMSEVAPGSSTHRHFTESVVGHLIGSPGIDLTLIKRLDAIRDDSTDRLTLEGVSGDVAVLDWHPTDVTRDLLHAAGFDGRRTPHPNDPQAAATDTVTGPMPGSTKRKVYLFDLRDFDDPADLCDALSNLRAAMEIRTFTLMPGPKSATPSSRAEISISSSSSTSSADSAPASGPPAGHADRVGSQPQAGTSPRPPSADRSTAAGRSDLHLDQLLDGLDEFDRR
jgi:hypothetical protein